MQIRDAVRLGEKGSDGRDDSLPEQNDLGLAVAESLVVAFGGTLTIELLPERVVLSGSLS